MCRRHWFTVPKRLQLAVYKHYRPGQCDDMDVSPEWVMAATAAIKAVEIRERKTTEEAAMNALRQLRDNLKIEYEIQLR